MMTYPITALYHPNIIILLILLLPHNPPTLSMHGIGLEGFEPVRRRQLALHQWKVRCLLS